MGDYKVHNVYWKAGSINIQVLEIPVEDVEDKLIVLSENKGLINKVQYEDFLLSNCLLNTFQILQILLSKKVFEEDLVSMRKDMIRIILDVNPYLRPESLIINKNNVIKSTVLNKELKGRPLMSNKVWNSKIEEEAYIYNMMNPFHYMNPQLIPRIDSAIMQDMMKPSHRTPEPIDKKTVWWNRMSMHVVINLFDKENLVELIGGKNYKNKTSYMSYLITKCIEDADKLVAMCDQTGLSKRVPEPILIEEMYEMILKINPHLKYEDINFEEIEEQFEEDTYGTNDQSGWGGPPMFPFPPPTPGDLSMPPGFMSFQKGKKHKDKKHKKSFDKVERKKLLKLGEKIKERIIGQDESIDLIVDAVQRAAAGLRKENQPIGSFIFTGQTGCGKTECSKILADKLIGNQSDLLVVDCSEYSQDHEYAKLIGAPPSFVGYDDGGYLTNAMMTNPFRIVLFDEFEKASPKMHDLLLQIFDEGRLTDGKGRRVSFRDAIIILTANLGVREVEKARNPLGFQQDPTFTEDKKKAALMGALKKTFKPEFINRVDEIVHFRSLDKEDYLKIIDLMFEDLDDLLKKQDLKLKVSKKVKEFIYEKGVDPKYGARPLKRTIKREVETPLARMIINEEVPKGSTISVKYDDGVRFDIKNKKEKKDVKEQSSTENN